MNTCCQEPHNCCQGRGCGNCSYCIGDCCTCNNLDCHGQFCGTCYTCHRENPNIFKEE